MVDLDKVEYGKILEEMRSSIQNNPVFSFIGMASIKMSRKSYTLQLSGPQVRCTIPQFSNNNVSILKLPP